MIDQGRGTMTVYIVTGKQSRMFIALEQFPSKAKEWLDGGFNVEEFVFDVEEDPDEEEE